MKHDARQQSRWARNCGSTPPLMVRNLTFLDIFVRQTIMESREVTIKVPKVIMEDVEITYQVPAMETRTQTVQRPKTVMYVESET
jgi:hypothetical protein